MEKSICEIHDTPLEMAEVPLRYGLQMEDPASEVELDLFPNARSYALGGCVFPDEPEPRNMQPVCMECRAAERRWREIHDPPFKHAAELSELFRVAFDEFGSKSRDK